jgi:hypothetical protein
MMALLLLSTALVILMESQWWAVDMQERANRINSASILAQDLMTELELRMEKEGFGELEVKEQGDFSDVRYGDGFDGFRWEYEVEKVDVELPDMSRLLGLAGEGAETAADAAGVQTGGASAMPEADLLSSLGVDQEMISELLGNYLREARVRVCYPDGTHADTGAPAENCVELITHLANPTGRVLTEEEQQLLDAAEEAGRNTP